MLNTGASVVVTELLDLTLALAIGGLVDRHLDLLIEIGHDGRSERAVVGVDHLVIDRPEAVEVEHLLVPLRDRLHLTFLLVTDTMVNVQEFGDGHQAIEDFSLRMVLEAGQEDSSVADTLNERVNRVTIGLHGGNDDCTIFIGKSLGLTDTDGTTADSLVVDSCCIVTSKRDILDTVTVLGVMSGEFLVIGVQGSCENEGELVVADNMRAVITGSRLQTLPRNKRNGKIRLIGSDKLKFKYHVREEKLTWYATYSKPILEV